MILLNSLDKFDSDSLLGAKRLELSLQISGGFRVEWLQFDAVLEADQILRSKSRFDNKINILLSMRVFFAIAVTKEPAIAGHNKQILDGQPKSAPVQNFDNLVAAEVGHEATRPNPNSSSSPSFPGHMLDAPNGHNAQQSVFNEITQHSTSELVGNYHGVGAGEEVQAEFPGNFLSQLESVGHRVALFRSSIGGQDQRYEMADLERVTETQPTGAIVADQEEELTLRPLKYTWFREGVHFVEAAEHNVLNEWGRPTVTLCDELIGYIT